MSIKKLYAAITASLYTKKRHVGIHMQGHHICTSHRCTVASFTLYFLYRLLNFIISKMFCSVQYFCSICIKYQIQLLGLPALFLTWLFCYKLFCMLRYVCIKFVYSDMLVSVNCDIITDSMLLKVFKGKLYGVRLACATILLYSGRVLLNLASVIHISQLVQHLIAGIKAS